MIEILLCIIIVYISIAFMLFVYLVFNGIKITYIMENIKITLEGSKKYLVYGTMSLLWPKTFMDSWRK